MPAIRVVPSALGRSQRREREFGDSLPGKRAAFFAAEELTYDGFVSKLYVHLGDAERPVRVDEDRDADHLRWILPIARAWLTSRGRRPPTEDEAAGLSRAVLEQLLELKRQGLRPGEVKGVRAAKPDSVSGLWRAVLEAWAKCPILDGADREWVLVERLESGAAPPSWLDGGVEAHVTGWGLTPGQKRLYAALRRAGVDVRFLVTRLPGPGVRGLEHLESDLGASADGAPPITDFEGRPIVTLAPPAGGGLTGFVAANLGRRSGPVSTLAGSGLDGAVEVWRCPSPSRQARVAARRVREWLEAGVRPEAIAVGLPRLERQRALFEAEFHRYGAPFQTRLGEPATEHALVRWVLDMLEMLSGGLPLALLERVLGSGLCDPLWPGVSAEGNEWLVRVVRAVGYFDAEDQPLEERVREALDELEKSAEEERALSVAEVRRCLWMLSGDTACAPGPDDAAAEDPPKPGIAGLLRRFAEAGRAPCRRLPGLLSDLSGAFASPRRLADRSARDFIVGGVRQCARTYTEEATLEQLQEALGSFLEAKRVLYRPERGGVHLVSLREMAGARFRKAIVADLQLETFPGTGSRGVLLDPETLAQVNGRLREKGLDPLRTDEERRAREAALWADAVASVEEELILCTPFNRETRRDEQESTAVLDTAALFEADAEERAWAAAHGLGDDPVAGRLPVVEFPLAAHVDFGPGANPDSAAAEAWDRWQGEPDRRLGHLRPLSTRGRDPGDAEEAGGPGGAPDEGIAFRRGVCLARRAYLEQAAALDSFQERARMGGEHGPWDAWAGRLDAEVARSLFRGHLSPTAAEAFHRDRLEYLYGSLLGIEPQGAPDEDFSVLLMGSLLHELVRRAVGVSEVRQWREPGRPEKPLGELQERLDHHYRLGVEVGRQEGRRLVEWRMKQALTHFVEQEPECPWSGWECVWEFPLNGVTIDLGGGSSVPMRGFVDRVARRGEVLWVVDYKSSTGSTGYDRRDFTKRAQVLQGPLYRLVVSFLPETYLRRPSGVAGVTICLPETGRPRWETNMRYHFLRQPDTARSLGYPMAAARRKNVPGPAPAEEEASILFEAVRAVHDAFNVHGDFRSAPDPGPFARLKWLTRQFERGGRADGD